MMATMVMLLSYSCATLFLGSKQNVRINSEPPGARVYVNGENTGKKTPCKIKIDRKVRSTNVNKRNQQVYVLRKNGYHDYVYKSTPRTHWLAYPDFAFYIVPGLIDLAVGSLKVYEKDVDVTLPKADVLVQEKKVVVRDTVVKREMVYVKDEKDRYVFEKKSDVDKDIPVNAQTHPYRFALIIGNEDYASHQIDLNAEVNVDYARNDASAFKAYAENLLGIPERNIIFLLDATSGKMNQAISKLNLIIKNTKGRADVFVYYAGHGLPDEVTREPYLMPVDVSGKNAKDGIKLQNVYAKLTQYPSQKITVFIDACFSGGARNQGLLAARGVKIKPRASELSGNLVAFTSSSGSQSSLPLKDEAHGLYTYYLLKKLKETGGNITYNALSDYLKDHVALQSVLLNDKEQIPQTNISYSVTGEWSNWKLNE